MLTVCIPYRHKDARFYDPLIQQLHVYAKNYPVEFMSLPNDGSRSIGDYRQQLLDNTQTPYVVFIDADDQVNARYFELIFEGLAQGVDCVGFRGLITTDGRNPHVFEHSADHTTWFEKRKNGRVEYFRPINHLNPIKTDIARQIGYSDLKHGEDFDYSMRLSKSGLIKSSYFVPETIYYYRYRSRK
jgi:hypothetical protein